MRHRSGALTNFWPRWKMRLDKIRCLLLLATALGAVLVITGCGSSYTAPNNPPPPPPATTVTVTPPTATLYRGETVRFSAQVSGPSDKTVTWSVPAGFGSIDSTGLYTAPSDASHGTINVTATSN